MTLEHFLVFSAVLFSIGLYGALTKRNAITALMAIELMFNAVIVAAVAVSKYVAPAGLRTAQGFTSDTALEMVLTGQVLAMFVIAVAAAEIALGLALVIAIYRSRDTVDLTQINLMRR